MSASFSVLFSISIDPLKYAPSSIRICGVVKSPVIEARLEKLEVIHTRYTGDRGPQGPKGDKGDKGDPGKTCGELNEFRNERLAFREELYTFKSDLRDQFIKHTNDLAETQSRYADELARAYTDGVRSLCDAAVKK